MEEYIAPESIVAVLQVPEVVQDFLHPPYESCKRFLVVRSLLGLQ